MSPNHLSRPGPHRWLVLGSIALASLGCATSASAQSFLANKKFDPSEVNAHNSSILTFELFNARAGDLSATLTDTLPATTPAGELWFSSTDVATAIRGSASTDTCTTGTITLSDFFDAPDNTKARTLTITGANVPPRAGGTTQPNCQIAIPVHAGAVTQNDTVTNEIPDGGASASDAAGTYASSGFSASLLIRAPVNPLVTTKSFSPALVAGGSTATLSITVRNNTNPAVPLTGVTFIDTLPGSLITTGAPTFSSQCGSPNTNTGANAASVHMADATIAAGQTCTVTVTVQAPLTTETLTNVIEAGDVIADGGYTNAAAARATLNVRSTIKMTKAFGNNGSTTAWRTDEAPTPTDLHGVTFGTTPATALVNQPVPVRVYFSNPTANDLTGGRISDLLPGETALVSNDLSGSTCNVASASVTTSASASREQVVIDGFSVPAASGSQPGRCYVQFYVKTTGVTTAAINALSTAGSNSDVTFSGGTTTTTFPEQSTSARLTTTGDGTGPGTGYVTTAKSFITASGTYTGTTNPARVDKGQVFQMRVAVHNRVFDSSYSNGSISDTLPAGLKVADSPNITYGVSDGCSVRGTVNVSGKTITYSGWTVLSAAPPNNTGTRANGCSYTIDLVSDDAAAPGGSDSINTIATSEVSATQDSTGNLARAQGDVAARAIVKSDLDTTKSFSPSTIGVAPGAITRLTIAFNNKNANTAITGLAVTDPLPSSAAFGNLLVATPPNTTNTCGGTLTADPGSASVSLSGATVPAGASCQVEVDVVTTGGNGTASSVTNTIVTGGVSNDQGQGNNEPITATLSKSGANGINLVKRFAESSALGGRSVPLTLDFTATATSVSAQDQITVTDNLPDGMLVAATPAISTTCLKADGVTAADVTIADDRQSFTVSGFRFDAYSDGAVPHNRCSVVLNMVLTTTGNKTNTIPAGAISTDIYSTNPSLTQATLSAQPNTALEKQFEPKEIAAGQVSTLTLSIVNVNTEPRTDFSITDTLPTGMRVAAGQAETTCGGTLTATRGSTSVSITGGEVDANATCTITVPVTVSEEGTYVNNASNITATTYIDTTETQDELTAGPPLPVTPVPTLGEWAMWLLMAALASLGLTRLRAQRA